MWRRVATVCALVAALGGSAWAGHEYVLRSAADLWIVADPIGPADAIAVFGGGPADRPFAAAQYYRQGLAKKIIVDDPDSTAVLRELAIPASVIESFGSALQNTHGEVLALRDWAQHHDLHSVIVLTEIFPTRRVRWMMHHVFPNDFVIRVIALDPPGYRRDDWWRHGQGVVTFRTEVVKYFYYLLRY